MNKTFYGHTPKVNGLLNLDRSDTHIHNIEAKRCKVNNDSATYLWHCRLGHIGVKRMKKVHADGLLESRDYESFDTGSVAKSSNSKRELQNEQKLVKGEVTMCVGSDSKFDKITIAHSLYLRV